MFSGIRWASDPIVYVAINNSLHVARDSVIISWLYVTIHIGAEYFCGNNYVKNMLIAILECFFLIMDKHCC